MGDLVELLNFFSKPSRRKFITVVGLLLAFLVALLLYERFTASFRLGRLQKENELLARLEEIQNRGTNSSAELSNARKLLIAHTVQVIEEKPLSLEFVPSKLTFSMESFWKFVLGGALWWSIALYHLLFLKEKIAKEDVIGNLCIGLLGGFCAIFVPAFWWPWFHIFIYPWLFILAGVSLLLPLAILLLNVKSAKRKAQENKCINNLRQIDSATQQWALEHNKQDDAVPTIADVIPYLKGGALPKCPCCGTYSLNAVGAQPTCSFAGHGITQKPA